MNGVDRDSSEWRASQGRMDGAEDESLCGCGTQSTKFLRQSPSLPSLLYTYSPGTITHNPRPVLWYADLDLSFTKDFAT